MVELLEIVVTFEDDSMMEFEKGANQIIDELITNLEQKFDGPLESLDNRILLINLSGRYISGRQLIKDIVDGRDSLPNMLTISWRAENGSITAKIPNVDEEYCYLSYENTDNAITVGELINQLQQCDPEKKGYVLLAELEGRGFVSEPVVKVDNSSKESTALLTWDYQTAGM